MSGPHRATRPLRQRPRATHRLRCARGPACPVRARCRPARSRRCARAAFRRARPFPFTPCRRPARRCRTALRARRTPPRLRIPRAAPACALVCTPCVSCSHACEGAIPGRADAELCLGGPGPIRYFERSRRDGAGAAKHRCCRRRARPVAMPARAARGRRHGARAAGRVVRQARPGAIAHRDFPFDSRSLTGARPPCPHFATSVTPGRPSRAPP